MLTRRSFIYNASQQQWPTGWLLNSIKGTDVMWCQWLDSLTLTHGNQSHGRIGMYASWHVIQSNSLSHWWYGWKMKWRWLPPDALSFTPRHGPVGLVAPASTMGWYIKTPCLPKRLELTLYESQHGSTCRVKSTDPIWSECHWVGQYYIHQGLHIRFHRSNGIGTLEMHQAHSTTSTASASILANCNNTDVAMLPM